MIHWMADSREGCGPMSVESSDSITVWGFLLGSAGAQGKWMRQARSRLLASAIFPSCQVYSLGILWHARCGLQLKESSLLSHFFFFFSQKQLWGCFSLQMKTGWTLVVVFLYLSTSSFFSMKNKIVSNDRGYWKQFCLFNQQATNSYCTIDHVLCYIFTIWKYQSQKSLFIK